MKLTIGDTVRRTAPWGDVVTREIQSKNEIKNYLDMEKGGFKLEVIQPTVPSDDPFNDTQPVKLRIHKNLEECESCSA